MPDDLVGGGGRPQDPSMEARLTAVETGIADIKATLGRFEVMLERIDRFELVLVRLEERLRKVETDLAELKGRVSQLPSTVAMIGFVLAVLAAGGLMRHFFP